ncbi:hypothetical protein ACFLY7_01080 [Patescibacteria group bacterium]
MLPNKQKKKIFKIYIMRLAIVFMGGVLSLIILATIFLIPSYFLVHIKEQAVIRGEDIFNQSISLRKDSDLMLTLRDEREKIDNLKDVGSEGKITKTLQLILSKKSDKVKIDTFLSEDRGEVNKVVLKGVAERRSNLIDLISVLREQENFTNVDLPISDLVKEVDVDFSISIDIVS